MKILQLVAILLLFGIHVNGQNFDRLLDEFKQANEKPKIGLALSGGAAHGLSHVGVIKYLEELGIGIDYVTGTSMGAIVGGLYSMGYSYSDMKEIISGNNWDAIISNETKLYEVSSIEKPYHDKIPISLRIEKSQFLLPKAIYEGHKLDLSIDELFSPDNLLKDFDQLPIPFRCFAVDLLSGTIVKFKDGNLGEAIRASMAIPSIFTPVEKDSFLLVDGGLLVNFPVIENFEMGSDLVIGVYVGSKRSKKEEVNSMLDVLRLTGFLSSLNNTELQKEVTDILIEPDVKDLPLLDFQNFDELVSKGYEAAKKDSANLINLASYLSQFAPKKKVLPLKLPPELFVEDVVVLNNGNIYGKFVEQNLKHLKQKNISVADIISQFNKTFSSKNLSHISYDIKEGSLGDVLEVDYEVLVESKIGISANHFPNTNSSLLFSATLRNVIFPFSNIMGLVRLSDNPAALFHYYNRIGDSKKYLFNFKGYVGREKNPIFNDAILNKELVVNKSNLTIGLSKEHSLSELISLEYGLSINNIKPQLIRESDIRDIDENHQILKASYTKNNLTKWNFPIDGVYLYANAGFLHNVSQEITFTNVDAKTVFGIPTEKANYFLQFMIEQNTPLNDDFIAESSFSLGYFSEPSLVAFYSIGGTDNYRNEALPFIGAEQGEFRLEKYLYARQALRYRLLGKVNLTAIINIVRLRSFNNTFIDRLKPSQWNTEIGYGFSIGIDTVIGPVNIDIGSKNQFKDITFGVGVGYTHLF